MTQSIVSNYATKQFTNRKWRIPPSGIVCEIKEIQTGQGSDSNISKLCQTCLVCSEAFSSTFSHAVPETCFNEYYLFILQNYI